MTNGPVPGIANLIVSVRVGLSDRAAEGAGAAVEGAGDREGRKQKAIFERFGPEAKAGRGLSTWRPASPMLVPVEITGQLQFIRAGRVIVNVCCPASAAVKV
jgi:hypothetical protein